MKIKIISILMVLMMCFSCFACNAKGEAPSVGGTTAGVDDTTSTDGKHELQLLKSDQGLTAEDLMSRIKSEYLIENGGYQDEDEIVVILSLSEPSVVESFNSTKNNSYTPAEYALTSAGQAVIRNVNYQQKKVIRSLTDSGLIDEVEYTYSTITNAIAVKTTYGKLSDLENRADVEYVMLSDDYNRPQTIEGDVSSIINLVDVYQTGIFKPTGVDLTGRGTSVAVLDSGFDCSHEVFNTVQLDKDSLMFNSAFISEFLSSADSNAAETTSNLQLKDVYYSDKIPFVYDYADKDPDVFPYDSSHGTHVAGIIGGYSKDDQEFLDIEEITETEFRGIAPETQLVLMKVFPDYNSGAKTEDILAALEDAIKLGVDAINMSLGSSCGFAREEDYARLNDVYDAISASGINLVTAASNDYSSGMGGEQGNTNKVTNPDSGTVGSPSTYNAALSVASISGVKSKYLIGNDDHVMFFNESNNIAGEENNFFAEIYEDLGVDKSQTITMEYVTIPGIGMNSNYATFDEGYLNGKIALVRRGETTFEDKALQAKLAGAAAIIIYNNIEGDILMSMGKSDHIPCVSISKEDGEKLAAYSEGTFTFKFTNEAGPFMSDFSSWGPTPSLGLKPEITGHGGKIISAVPGGGYQEQSGTSMACPNLCGITVLIKQYLKDDPRFDSLTPYDFKVLTNQLMMSTATIAVNEEGNPYFVRKQGAGLASLFNSVNTKAYITVDGKDKTKLELGDDPQRTGVYTMKFNVVNISNVDVTYDLSVIGLTESVSTSDEEFVAERSYVFNNSKTEFAVTGDGKKNGESVTVSAGKTAKIEVTYTLSEEEKKYIDNNFPYGMYVEGFVKLDAQGDEIDLNVPYLSFYGDWTEAPLFDKTLYEVDPDAKNNAINFEDKLKADYYATTPYGSYYYNYIIPLGRYIYNVDESKYDQPAAKEEYISMSDELDSINGIYAVYAGLLRCAKEMKFTITDKATGEIIYEYTDYNAFKAHYNNGVQFPYIEDLGLKVNEQGWQNNSVYEFKMTGLLDYGDGGVTTNVRNTFSFDFTVDTEAPIIKSAYYEKEYDKTDKKDRYYITLSVYDNHYIQSIQPVAFSYDAKENVNEYTLISDYAIPVQGEKGSTNTVRFEITDFLEDMKESDMATSSIAFHIDDYALNSNLYFCTLPTFNDGLMFTTDGTVDGEMLTYISANVGEVVDLTQFLCSTDETIGSSKDYAKFLLWGTYNPDVVTVSYGSVICKAPGDATVVITEDIYGTWQKQIMVRVKDPNEESVENSDSTETPGLIGDLEDQKIKEIRFTHFQTIFAYPYGYSGSEIGETGSKIFINARPEVAMYPGEKIQLFYNLTPWYVEENYEFIFESTNEKVAKVDPETGEIEALKEGTTTIVLREKNRKTNLRASYSLEVKSEFIIESRQLLGYKGLGGDVVIPDDEGIYYISSFAFCNYTTDVEKEVDETDWDANKTPGQNTTITSITIPYGVEYIQRQAFDSCVNLETVTFIGKDGKNPISKDNPGSVSYIQNKAFYKCEKLTEIDLSEIEVIGWSAFSGCTSLNNINLSKCYSLGENAFSGCTSLTDIDVTALRNASNFIFNGCTSLKNVTLGKDTKLSKYMFDNTAIEEITIYETEEIPSSCFSNCKSLTTVNIVNDLIYLGNSAFSGCTSLTTVNTKNIGTIGSYAFNGCSSLTTYLLPEGNVTLEDNVFSGCSNLRTVKFGKTTNIVSALGRAFYSTVTTFDVDGSNPYYTVDGEILYNKDKTALLFIAPSTTEKVITIPSSVKEIGTGAFAGTKITEITLTNKDTVINSYAFANCSYLKLVTLPSEAGTVIKDGAFKNAGVQEDFNIVNLDKVISIGTSAFESSKLVSATIGDDTTVGNRAFASSKVSNVTLGNGVTLGAEAFKSCTSLTTVTIEDGDSVTLNKSVFESCTSLNSINLSGIANIPEKAFYKCTSLQEADLSATKVIENYAFAGCSSLETVTIPVVEEIGAGAFAFADSTYVVDYLEEVRVFDSLTIRERESNDERPVFKRSVTLTNAPILSNITLPASLTKIGSFAFAYSHIANVTIPENITAVSEFAFIGTELTSVTLNNASTEIGRYAFAYSQSLATINLENIVTVKEYAFNGTAISSVDFSSMETVNDYAFANAKITSVTANNLKTVGNGAFSNNGISTISLAKVETIGDSAFEYNDIQTFTVAETLKTVGEKAFYGCENFTAFVNTNNGKDGAVGKNVVLDNGVLYIVAENGSYELVSVPAAAEIKDLVVLDGTQKVVLYAGNENKNIESIVFPDGLKVIANYAFYGCDSIKEVEFKSVIAPILESYGDATENQTFGRGIPEEFYGSDGLLLPEHKLTNRDPGYTTLNAILSNRGYHPTYYTFIDLVGKNMPISLILPANEDIEGYDGIIYQVYFGKVEDATRSDYVAMEKNMIDFIENAKKVGEINEVMLIHENLINNALSNYNAITQNYADYGIDDEEWNVYVNEVTTAKEELKAIILANASPKVRQLQEEIKALTSGFSISDYAVLKDLTKRIDDLVSADRAKLDLTEYDAKMKAYNEYLASLESKVTPVISSISNTFAGVIAAVASVATVSLGGIALAILKKRWFI